MMKFDADSSRLSKDITDEFFEESTKRVFKKLVLDPKDLNPKERYDRFESTINHDLHEYFHRVDDDWKDNQREDEIARFPLPPTPKFNQMKRTIDFTLLEKLLEKPARDSRPARVMIFLRGAPGSGKTFLAKKIMKKEEENGGTRNKLISCNRYYAKRFNDQDMKIYRDYLYDEVKDVSEEGFYNFVLVEVEGGEMEYYTKLMDVASFVGGFECYTFTIHQKSDVCIKYCRHKRKNKDIENIVRDIERNYVPHNHKLIDPMYIVDVNPNDEKEKKNTDTYERRRMYNHGSSDSDEEAFMTCIG